MRIINSMSVATVTTALVSATSRLGSALAYQFATTPASRHQLRRGGRSCTSFSILRAFAISSTTPSHADRLFPEELNVLYDSKCNVCKLEIDFLRKRDLRLNGGDGETPQPRLRFTDLESDYNESDPRNGGITYAVGMKSMHAVTSSGEVMKGVPVFEKAYEQVQLGWLFYALHKVPGFRAVANFFYDIFSRYRTLVTRGSNVDSLIQAFEEKKQLEEKKKQSMAAQECSDENNSCAVKGNVSP
eukprot:CAMPEP_0172466216 /NCGR_PEP_ID=MMETSP1065-20121228/55529_1 /TAXON_ID=265537 /ORGANISM="Amphiprora paludosa, Strain CCMP125" /LENGTH=243 /DNA_ID=CAMNT_0013222957 /DNA_START=15 /DNA_END=746 /DNA_ORIENTATION=+